MYYVCIENNLIVSIINYEPALPESVRVVEISDNDYTKIAEQTHFFNIETDTVESLPTSILAEKEKDVKNAEYRELLTKTDWKVLRHFREKALNIETSLTENQYLELERQRESAANSIL